MTHAKNGAFASSRTSYSLDFQLIDQFRLGFGFENVCISGAHATRSAVFNSLKDDVEISVPGLLATAALRHSGTSYHGGDPAIAMAKELVMWLGWLNVREDGKLRLDSAANSGRLAEVSASLGEAVALDLAVELFDLPLPLWVRIPESGGEAMDFKAPGPNGDIAIEAKAGHGSVVAAKKKEIAIQKDRQTAAEKYGFVLCYEKSGHKHLKSKGSYVKVVDPPGDDVPATSRRSAILEHYRQISTSIGLEWLTEYLGEMLKNQPDAPRRELLRKRGIQMLNKRRVRSEELKGDKYLGRYFDLAFLLGGEPASANPNTPKRYFFFGISKSVLSSLLGDDLDTLLEGRESARFSFSTREIRSVDPILVARTQYTGLSDGILRVDFVSADHTLTDEFDDEDEQDRPVEGD